MTTQITALALTWVLTGCAGTYMGDAFEMPLLEHSCTYEDCGASWSAEDRIAYAKMEAAAWQKGYRDVMGHSRPESEDVRSLESYNVSRWKPEEGAVGSMAREFEKTNNQDYAYSSDASPVNSYEGAYKEFPFSTPCLDYSHRAYDLAAEAENPPKQMRVVTLLLSDGTLDTRGGPKYGYGKDSHALLLVDGVLYDNGYLSNMPFDYKDLAFYGEEIDNIWSPNEYR